MEYDTEGISISLRESLSLYFSPQHGISLENRRFNDRLIMGSEDCICSKTWSVNVRKTFVVTK